MSPNYREKVVDNEVYHIITRGNDKKEIFHADKDFVAYLSLLGSYKEEFPVKIFHYCLMPNHVHLLIQAVRGLNLVKFMQGLNLAYGYHYKRQYGSTGHLWEGRYRRIRIVDDTYLLECGRYIERNPVRAKLVEKPEQWIWSSSRFYTLNIFNHLIDRPDFYPDSASWRKDYRTYLQTDRLHSQTAT